MRAFKTTRDAIIWAYRLLLDREPESPGVVEHWVSHTPTLDVVRDEILHSEEFLQKNSTVNPSLTGMEEAIYAQIDTELTRTQLAALFDATKRTWTTLGAANPLWAVFSTGEFSGTPDHASVERFYASGAWDIGLIRATLRRNGTTLPTSAHALEFGCGVGRVTSHLAREFDRVTGVDISATMLDHARVYMKESGINNVSFKLLDSLEDVAALPTCDFFYSMIVMQHSPPPLISSIIHSAISSLTPGGLALFQVPTYIPKYRFDADEYLSGEAQAFQPAHGQYELHALRQPDLFAIIGSAGGVLLEILENRMLGPDNPGAMSNTLLVRKGAPRITS